MAPWNDTYQQLGLVAYHAIHGHCFVKLSENTPLNYWCRRQNAKNDETSFSIINQIDFLSGKKWFQISFQTKLWETHDFTKYMMYNNFNWNLGHTRVLTSAPPGSTNIISAYGCVYPNNKVFIKKDVFLWRRYNVCKFHWISMESQQYAKRS